MTRSQRIDRCTFVDIGGVEEREVALPPQTGVDSLDIVLQLLISLGVDDQQRLTAQGALGGDEVDEARLASACRSDDMHMPLALVIREVDRCFFRRAHAMQERGPLSPRLDRGKEFGIEIEIGDLLRMRDGPIEPSPKEQAIISDELGDLLQGQEIPLLSLELLQAVEALSREGALVESYREKAPRHRRDQLQGEF